MDADYIADHHVVARFLSDQLSDVELQAFEQYILAHPDIVAELEATARLKVGFHKLYEIGGLATLLKPKSYFGHTRYIALAASIAILALGLLFTIRYVFHESPILAASMSAFTSRSGISQPLAHTYVLLRTRGNAYDAEINLPSKSQTIELRVLPEFTAHPPRYRVTLARIADDDSLREVGAVTGLIPDATDFLSVYADESKLTRGRYRLTLSGDVDTDAAQAMSTFKIKISAPSGS